MITMEIETFNQYVIKIIISARNQDSINLISKRIGLSYGWTYKWVKRLSELGVFKISRTRLQLNKKNKLYRNILKFIKANLSKDVGFNYSVLNLFGISYCFTKTDSTFIWTKGAYNIARYKDYYPIFIKLKKDDLVLFKEYCKKLDLKINRKKGVFYSIETLKEIKPVFVNRTPVDSLDETIAFMKKHIYNFQPALEIIQDMYHKRLKVKYREIEYV